MVNMEQSLSLFEQIRKEFAAKNSDANKKCYELLDKMKVELTKLNYLLPTVPKPDPKELLLAREVLEIGALLSIRIGDVSAFERYFVQLKVYYYDLKQFFPPGSDSAREHQIIGLNLLRLLAQNRIAEFHTELELVHSDLLHNSIYIKHPVQLEQALMEGSYNKVINARADVPAEEYSFFINILMETIRHDIGDCMERAYDSLLVEDAAALTYYKDMAEFKKFVEQRQWHVDNARNLIVFEKPAEEMSRGKIAADRLISDMLHYAKELERIV